MLPTVPRRRLHGPSRLRLRSRVARPAVLLALRAALAATLAWLVVQPWGGAADTYAYYAPLGAVVSVSTTLLQSVRSTVQSALALVLGALLAVAALASELPEVLGLALAVGVGTLLSYWRHLGSMASWVPISALFVLIVGRADLDGYLVGYLGLTTLGAVVGACVSWLFPPLPLARTVRAQQALRSALADQLDDLVGGLRAEQLPGPTGWSELRRDLGRQTREVQELVALAADARRGNWRARRWRATSERARQQGRTLANLTLQIEQLVDVLAEDEHAGRSDVALGPLLRPVAADALGALAATLRSVEHARADADAHARARREVEKFASAVRRRQREVDGEFFAAGSLVTATRRALAALAPGEEDTPRAAVAAP